MSPPRWPWPAASSWCSPPRSPRRPTLALPVTPAGCMMRGTARPPWSRSSPLRSPAGWSRCCARTYSDPAKRKTIGALWDVGHVLAEGGPPARPALLRRTRRARGSGPDPAADRPFHRTASRHRAPETPGRAAQPGAHSRADGAAGPAAADWLQPGIGHRAGRHRPAAAAESCPRSPCSRWPARPGDCTGGRSPPTSARASSPSSPPARREDTRPGRTCARPGTRALEEPAPPQ